MSENQLDVDALVTLPASIMNVRSVRTQANELLIISSTSPATAIAADATVCSPIQNKTSLQDLGKRHS